MKALIVGGLSAAILTASLAATAQQLDIEKQIEFRQAGYKFMSWNMGKIKAQVIDGDVEYNPLQVQAAANTIAAISNSGMGALFSPGSSRAEMGEITALRPEFFENLNEAGKLGRNFNVAANNLASEAASGDQARIRKAFGEVGQTCKACHDQFRITR